MYRLCSPWLATETRLTRPVRDVIKYRKGEFLLRPGFRRYPTAVNASVSGRLNVHRDGLTPRSTCFAVTCPVTEPPTILFARRPAT